MSHRGLNNNRDEIKLRRVRLNKQSDIVKKIMRILTQWQMLTGYLSYYLNWLSQKVLATA
jgi:hypothetical protein